MDPEGNPTPHKANPRKLETGLRPNSAGIPYTVLLMIEATGFPTVRLGLYTFPGSELMVVHVPSKLLLLFKGRRRGAGIGGLGFRGLGFRVSGAV